MGPNWYFRIPIYLKISLLDMFIVQDFPSTHNFENMLIAFGNEHLKIPPPCLLSRLNFFANRSEERDLTSSITTLADWVMQKVILSIKMPLREPREKSFESQGSLRVVWTKSPKVDKLFLRRVLTVDWTQVGPNLRPLQWLAQYNDWTKLFQKIRKQFDQLLKKPQELKDARVVVS